MILKILFYLVLFTALFFITVRYIERNNLYFPTRQIEANPDEVNIPYEDVYFVTEDGKRLNGWFFPGETKGDVILLCHGNGGNISHRLSKIAILKSFGYAIFIFDYRGYGKSEGSPSEKGLYIDTSSAYEYLIKNKAFNGENIVVYGESLGGACALNLAMTKEVRGVITEGTFSSLRGMGRVAYPIIPSFVISNKFDSLSTIEKVKAPKLIMHSVDDEIIPFSMGEELYEKAPNPKRLVRLHSSHNSAYVDSEEEYRRAIEDFLTTTKK